MNRRLFTITTIISIIIIIIIIIIITIIYYFVTIYRAPSHKIRITWVARHNVFRLEAAELNST